MKKGFLTIFTLVSTILLISEHFGNKTVEVKRKKLFQLLIMKNLQMRIIQGILFRIIRRVRFFGTKK